MRGSEAIRRTTARHYILVPMRSRVLWRRSATALGVYLSTALGLLTTIVATRGLGVSDYAQLRRDPRRDGVLPGAARPDRRGRARQVRLPLRRDRAVGTAAAACSRSRSLFKIARRRAGRDRDRAAGAVRAGGLGRRRRARADADRRAAAAGAGARDGRRRRDHPARPLRRARLRSSPSRPALRLVGIGDRHAVRPRRRGDRADPRAGLHDGGDLGRRARRVPPLPAGALRDARRATAATCGSS